MELTVAIVVILPLTLVIHLKVISISTQSIVSEMIQERTTENAF